jgi:HSP20 family protein
MEDLIMLPIRRFNDQAWIPTVFNDFFNNDWMVKANATAPSVNVLENEKEYKIEVAAPGMNKEDFSVNLDSENNLVVRMEKKNEKKENEGTKYLRREFSYTHFEQSFTLADDIDKEKISADVNNGVLTICLPKFDEATKAKACRAIEIN